MTERNRYGLSRTIPEDVKLAVRRRCGFGCVECGLIPYQYDHFDPEFKDAREHRADGITLLCPNHHAQAGRVLSRQTIRRRNADPYARLHAVRSPLDFHGRPPLVIAGPMFFIGTGPLITIGDLDVVRASWAPTEGAVLSARFSDSAGNESVVIDRNELQLVSPPWDVTLVNNRLEILERHGHQCLEIHFHPPFGIYIRRLDMRRGPYGLSVSPTHPIRFIGCSASETPISTDVAVLVGRQLSIGASRLQFVGGTTLAPCSLAELDDVATRGRFDLFVSHVLRMDPAFLNLYGGLAAVASP